MLSFYTISPILLPLSVGIPLFFYILTLFFQIIGQESFHKENTMCFKYAICSKIIFILETLENMYMGEMKFTCEPFIPQI